MSLISHPQGKMFHAIAAYANKDNALHLVAVADTKLTIFRRILHLFDS